MIYLYIYVTAYVTAINQAFKPEPKGIDQL
jgi:hypothetical protein